MGRGNQRDLYKMRTVTRLTGFSPELLRAWEARFDFLSPKRAPRGHRLYTEDDLLILKLVKALLSEGRSIGEVALAGRKTLLEQARQAPVGSDPARETAQTGESLGHLRERLVRGAVELDSTLASEALDAAFARVSPTVALSEVVGPAAHEIGRLWATGECSVAGEHLVSGLLAARVRQLVEAAARSSGGPLAVCACLPDELHELGSLVVAHHLSRRGHRVTLLGPNLPLEDLDKLCTRLKPATVCLSVSRTPLLEMHLPALVRLVERRGNACSFFVGGAGTAGGPDDLGELVEAGATIWPQGRPIRELDPGATRTRRPA